MRNLIWAAVAVAALTTCGCGDLLSLHPLYTARDCVADAGLAGRWEDEHSLLTVEAAGNGYDVTLEAKKDATEKELFEIHLLDVGGVRFADLVGHDAMGHMFLRVRRTGDELRFAFFDTKWLLDRIPHEKAEMAGGKLQAVLTGSTAEVRKLVEKYALDAQAYDSESLMKRVK